ncbi:hypothetical protein [Streptomyces justiciae]|uniref:Uncharacterized protein n=1 Tax=Streptomyces justiciae TaxID=2780140 RepID=A0ABU3LNG1_9ACTN|nr:hypothetical protein [Streptomyces justiciae]MDT7840766.1 hypothetical protein [Streptomyces justiciae]
MAGVSAAALGLTLGSAGSAAAGGPTSVLIVSPESAETASLYYSDREYGTLERLLGEPGAGSAGKPPEADLIAGPQINVTWMVHDVSPWRVDRVYPATDSEAVWIHTAANLDASTNGTWHRAQQPKVLRDLLKDLGVMGKASDGDSAVEYPPPWDTYGTDAEATQSPEPSLAAASARPSGPADPTDWWWALPGVAAGVGGTLLIRRAAARQKAGPPREEPRQELIDL